MKINSNATKQMEALMNKIDTFPNRIASIQQSALARSYDSVYDKLYDLSPAAKYLTVFIEESGRLGYKMTITPDKGVRTSSGGDAYIAASVFVSGRKSYKVKAKGNYRMVLRPESVPPYPKALWKASIPARKGFKEEIKREAKESVIKNLEYAIKRFGFGPKGGSAGLEDLPRIRSRAGRR
jgi:hypothetical protein